MRKPTHAPAVARPLAGLGLALAGGLLVALTALAGCGPPASDVVLYCSVDRGHAEPIVAAFEKQTGLKVEAYYDLEASKSVGLRRRLQEEASRPVCDVFWNNEVVQTVVLARQGLLQEYRSPAAADIPAGFRDPGGLWTGFAARARIVIVNTQRTIDETRRPTGTADFTDPAHADRAGMAQPLTGTTVAHVAAWLFLHGHDETFALLKAMRANKVHFGPGNAQVMRLVREGELDFGFTDTDDCLEAINEGYPVVQVVPDQEPGEQGVIVVPNTVSLVKGAPHPDAARRLIDFLLDRSTEAALAAGPSAQIPLRADVPRPAHVLDLSRLHVATIDWNAAGAAADAAADELVALFNS